MAKSVMEEATISLVWRFLRWFQLGRGLTRGEKRYYVLKIITIKGGCSDEVEGYIGDTGDAISGPAWKWRWLATMRLCLAERWRRV